MRIRDALLGCLALSCGLNLWGVEQSTRASEPSESLQRAEELLVSALEAECKGDLEVRKQLLAEASNITQDFAPAQWHLGKILDSDSKWRGIEESRQRQIENKFLDQYERIRSLHQDTVADHWKLATWCSQNKLGSQCIAHLNRIIELDPNHTAARTVLGHQLLAGEWLTSDDLQMLAERTRIAIASQDKYGRKAASILSNAISGIPKQETAARDNLMSIRDPLAVPAIESLSSGSPDPVVELVVEWLDVIDDPAASQSLVRFALLHPSSEIRYSAARRLKDKPLYDFVPELLTMLSGPVQFMAVPVFDRRGSFLGYRQAFAKEGMNEVRLAITDRGFQRELVASPADSRPLTRSAPVPRRGGARGLNDRLNPPRGTELLIAEYLDRKINQMSAVLANYEVNSARINSERENAMILTRNQQIGQILSQVSGLPSNTSSQEIWKWWDSYNETNYQSYKPQRYNYSSLAERVPQYSPSQDMTCECFIAGTQVMTHRGMRSIEQVCVGDLALSKDVNTGMLSWQPVIAVTFQPPTSTKTIILDEIELTCTSGHLFWVSGSGWKKTSEIAVGDWIHGAQEPMQVTGLQSNESQTTYNLEVLDHHTYFVGQCLVLSHDVTPRRTTRNIVPGYRPSVEDSIAKSSRPESGALAVGSDR